MFAAKNCLLTRPTSVAALVPQLISSASAQTTSVTLGTHATGDLLLMFAERESNSGITIPSGWGEVISQVGSNNMSVILYYKYAASGSETSGTWTNANGLIVEVWRNAKIGASAANFGASATVNYPALTMLNGTGTSWVAGFGSHRSVDGNMGTAPSGMTNSTNVAGATQDFASHNTGAGVSSWSSQNVAYGGTSSGYATIVVELLPVAWAGLIGANTSTTTTVAIPPHRPGDLIFIWTVGLSLPSKPSASGFVPSYADIDGSGSGSSIAGRTAQFVATGLHTSGTWTSSSGMLAVVITGQDATPIGGHAISGTTGSGGSVVAPSITMTRTSGTSILLHAYGGGDGAFTGYYSGVPGGYTARTPLGVLGTEYGTLLITKNVTTSDGTATVTNGRADGRELATTVEVLMA